MNTINPKQINYATAEFYNDETGDWENVELSEVKELVAQGVECQVSGKYEFDVMNDGEEEVWSTNIHFEVNEGQIHFNDKSFYEDLEIAYDEDDSNHNYESAAEMLRELLDLYKY